MLHVSINGHSLLYVFERETNDPDCALWYVGIVYVRWLD